MNSSVRNRLRSHWQRHDYWLFTLLSILMIMVIGFADYQTGPTYSLLLFYLVPILNATWFVGKKTGIAISFLCSIAWIVSHELSSIDIISPYQMIWNGFIRLGIFLLVAYLISWQWKLKHDLEEERSLALSDPLTGMLNKRGFLRILSRENKRSIRYRHPFSMAFIDLDNFKKVNDSFGHVVGDRFLQTFIKTIKSFLRSTDTIGRFGGDEFVILLPETGAEAALEVIQRARNLAQKAIDNQGFKLTVSIGLATYLRPHDNDGRYIQEVDELMYVAKRRGKNQIKHVIFDHPD